MKRTLLLLAAVVVSLSLAATASSRSTDYCQSIKAQNPYLDNSNFATFNGYTQFCFGYYNWTIKVQKLESGVWTNIGAISGGPTSGDRLWSLIDPPVLTVKCLYPNGTAMTVRDQLYVNIGGEGHTNGSDRALCHRQGGPSTNP